MDDYWFNLFRFTGGGPLIGWKCKLARDADCQSVLQVTTAIAQHAVLLIEAGPKRLRPESEEWLEKAAAAIHLAYSDTQIGYALCEAHFQDEADTRAFRSTTMFEHRAVSWHELVGKLSCCYAYNHTLGDSRRHPDAFWKETFDGLDLRLKDESTNAQKRLAKHSTYATAMPKPLALPYQFSLKLLGELLSVVEHYTIHLKEMFTMLEGAVRWSSDEHTRLSAILKEFEFSIREQLPNAREAIDTLSVAPRIPGWVTLDAGVSGESHAAILLAMAHRINELILSDTRYYFDNPIFDFWYDCLTAENLKRIEIGMQFEFMQAAHAARITLPSIPPTSVPGYLGIKLDRERRRISREGIETRPIELSDRPWELLTKFIRAESAGVSSNELKRSVFSDTAERQAISDLRRELTGLGLAITNGRGGRNRILISTSETSDDNVSG